MEPWVRSDRHLTFTLASVALDKMATYATEVLSGFVLPASLYRRDAVLSLESMYHMSPPIGGRHSHRFVMFSPLNLPNSTVVVTNRVDGFSSLSFELAAKHQMNQFQVISTPELDEYPQNLIRLWERGVEIRRVLAMKDSDRWVFLQSGTPTFAEDVAVYSRRKIKDRLNRFEIIEIMRRYGVDILSDGFWSSDRSAIYFLNYT